MSASIPKPFEHLSVQEAAAEIARLINTRPVTPGVGEIEALIRKAVSGSPAGGLAVGGLPVTITWCAQEIDALFRFEDAMDRGEYYQDRLPRRVPDDQEPPPVQFDDHRLAATTRRGVVQQMLLWQEADTLDELLSLVLATGDAFNGFAADHCPNGGTACETIERALEAMVRHLVNRAGATSPILRTHASPHKLLPVEQDTAAALAKARELGFAEEVQP